MRRGEVWGEVGGGRVAEEIRFRLTKERPTLAQTARMGHPADDRGDMGFIRAPKYQLVRQLVGHLRC